MGILAVMLALSGIFGMAAYSASKRIKELGIPVALGARRFQILQSAVGRPFGLLLFGSFVDLAAGLFTSQLLG
jgi:hypothetical protein